MTGDIPIDPGYVRRSTIDQVSHPIPPRFAINSQRSQSVVDHGPSSNAAQYLDQPSRKRQASVMSTETYSASSSPSDTGPTDPSQFCLCQPEPKIPRPRNAFILYRQHHHAGTVAQNPGLPNPDISKIIGEQWRLLPDKAKEEWKALAEEEKVRHSQQYPDYRYKPKRNSRVNSQSSSSGQPSQSLSEGHTPCQKCGGKVMNPPLTPYPPFNQNNGNLPPMAGIPPSRHQGFTVSTTPYPRMPATQQTVSPPHSARVRQYAEVFGQQPAIRHNARVQYIPVQQSNDHVMVSPDAKRRRFNTNVFVQGRPGYHEPQYHYAPHEMGPPPRNMLVQAPPQVQQMAARPQPIMQPTVLTQKPQSHGPRDPSLTLPPLQTPLARSRAMSQSNGSQSQKSGIEAMIRTIPVLNKLKILSQIAPQLAGPSPTSPPREIRGAILAVEGMDQASVMNMTASLAEQLGRDGKFAVRIFDGPNPYASLSQGHSSSNDNQENGFTSLNFLNVISEWHKISRDMVDYISHKPGDRPRDKSNEPIAIDMDDDQPTPKPTGSDEAPKAMFSLDFAMKSPNTRIPTPPSAISPKTMQQASELSLRSPPSEVPTIQEGEELPRRKSRIPAAALAMQAQARKQAELEAQARITEAAQTEVQVDLKSESQAQSQSDAPSSADQQDITPTAHRSPMSLDEHGAITNAGTKTDTNTGTNTDTITATNTSTIRPTTALSSNAIPIALVPHYQLTTVDASAIAMPITDAYSPHSHWQWLATIWRGCVGPDVTIVIKGLHDEQDVNMAGNIDENVRTNLGGGLTSGPVPVSSTGAGNANIGANANATNQAGATISSGSSRPSTVSATGAAPGAGSDTGPAVEVRLLDCRAVIVRTSMRRDSRSGDRRMSNAATTTSTTTTTAAAVNTTGSMTDKRDTTVGSMETMTGPAAEAWEKAKRRVGFEVEEFLRR